MRLLLALKVFSTFREVKYTRPLIYPYLAYEIF